jgi:hypothetical protein
VYHPVVCEIVWGFWLARLKAKYDRTCDSWRAQLKRAHAANKPPPPSPGDFLVWMAREFPETAAYVAGGGFVPASGDAGGPVYSERPDDNGPASGDEARLSADDDGLSAGHGGGVGTTGSGVVATVGRSPPTNAKSPDDFRSKQREVKLPPLTPPARAPDAGLGKGLTNGEFAAEHARLEREFGDDARLVAGMVQAEGVSAKTAFVRAFEGARVRRHGTAGSTIAMPSKRAASQLKLAHGEALRSAGYSVVFKTDKGERGEA